MSLTSEEVRGLVALATDVDSGCSVCVRSTVAKLEAIFPGERWARRVWDNTKDGHGIRHNTTFAEFAADCEPDEYR